jgi:hypothetical protein
MAPWDLIAIPNAIPPITEIYFLRVSVRVNEDERTIEYLVTDKTDGFICWTGSASNLAVAQSEAVLEAQIFLDPYVAYPPEPQWVRNAGPDAQN